MRIKFIAKDDITRKERKTPNLPPKSKISEKWWIRELDVTINPKSSLTAERLWFHLEDYILDIDDSHGNIEMEAEMDKIWDEMEYYLNEPFTYTELKWFFSDEYNPGSLKEYNTQE